VGVDYWVKDNWWVNRSVWRVDISATADIRFDNSANASGDVDIDPMVYSARLGDVFLVG